MKIFLSHSMSKLTPEQVEKIRTEAMFLVKKYYSFRNDIEFIDNYNHEKEVQVPEDAGPLWHLGRSIQQMEQADLVVFCDPYTEGARGCEIEKAIVDIYNLNYLTLDLKGLEI